MWTACSVNGGFTIKLAVENRICFPPFIIILKNLNYDEEVYFVVV